MITDPVVIDKYWGGVWVNEASTHVGYQSVTRLSRELKRHFGTSPINYTGGYNIS